MLKEYFEVSAVHNGEEGDSVVLEKDFDASEYRLIGKVLGEAPFQGSLVHRGWKTLSVRLPRVIGDSDKESSFCVITPAEVELS